MSDGFGGGFGRDSGTPKRRMLPAVTDVVRELARTASADPAVLFKAARSVVADELARVKQGFESAPLDVLVRRARRQLEQDGVVAPEPEPASEAKSISIPAPPLKARDRAPHPPPPDGPFASAGASDLDWEKDLPIQPDDAPFRSAILPLPPRSRAPQEIPDPAKTGGHAPVPAAPAAPPPAPKLPVPDRVVAPEGFAMDRSGSAARPKPVDDLPLFAGPAEPEPAPAPPPPVSVAPEPAAPEPPAFEMAAFTLPEPPSPSRVEPPAPRFETPPPPSRVEPPRFEPSRPSRVEPPEPRVTEPPPFEAPAPAPAPTLRLEPPIKSMSEMPPLASVVGDVTEPVAGPEMGEFAFKGKEEPPPPARAASRTGWLVAIVVVLAVGAGLVWAVRTFLSGGVVRVEAPPPVAKKRETPAPPAPATSAPAPAPVPAASAAKAAPKPAAAPAKPAPAAAAPASVPKGKAAPLVTPDWTGKPAVYVVHFSSHKDRPSAEKEAKRLAGEFGKPGRAVEVDLGEKGVWYRVVLGEFPTAEDARAWRAELEAKKTPNLGFVYEMRGR